MAAGRWVDPACWQEHFDDLVARMGAKTYEAVLDRAASRSGVCRDRA